MESRIPHNNNKYFGWSVGHAKTCCRECPNFMDRRDHSFDDLTGALKSVFCKLREQEIGAMVKHAAVVLPEEEISFGVLELSALIRHWLYKELFL